MKTIITALGLAAVGSAILGSIVVFSGMFNVAAGWEDPALIRWALVTTRENSIQSRASSIEAPAVKGADQIDSGFRSYREMCAICHTPPGAVDSPITKGLNPVPPDLAKSAENMSDAELFWAIKNGIRMTGMPAWGPTHKDQEMWDVVAFVKQLPNMTKENYLEMDGRLEKGHDHSGGGHGDEMTDGGGGHDDLGGGTDHHTPAAATKDDHSQPHSH